MDRRTFLFASAASAVVGTAVAEEPRSIPIIETGVHLWDLTRPQGAPYPSKGLAASVRTVFPFASEAQQQIQEDYFNEQQMSGERYRAHYIPKGVVGAIGLEASPWIEDNLWLLEACAKSQFMVGAIGNLKPEDKQFPEYLERYHKDPLFLGIRPRDAGYNIFEQSMNRACLDGLKLLAQAGLVLEVGFNPSEIESMSQAVVRISDAVPNLKIVVEHHDFMRSLPDLGKAYDVAFQKWQRRPLVYGKIDVFGLAQHDVAEHTARLDRVHDIYGEDRLVGADFFGSPCPDVEPLDNYYRSKSRKSAENFFWRNSLKAYNWVHRSLDQPQIAFSVSKAPTIANACRPRIRVAALG